jgi:hypothetical protein
VCGVLLKKSHEDVRVQLGMLEHVCNGSYTRGRDRRIASLRPDWAKLVRSYLKNKI